MRHRANQPPRFKIALDQKAARQRHPLPGESGIQTERCLVKPQPPSWFYGAIKRLLRKTRPKIMRVVEQGQSRQTYRIQWRALSRQTGRTNRHNLLREQQISPQTGTERRTRLTHGKVDPIRMKARHPLRRRDAQVDAGMGFGEV